MRNVSTIDTIIPDAFLSLSLPRSLARSHKIAFYLKFMSHIVPPSARFSVEKAGRAMCISDAEDTIRRCFLQVADVTSS